MSPTDHTMDHAMSHAMGSTDHAVDPIGDRS